MKRLLTSTRLPAALGLVVALQCFFPQTCSAHICWSWSTCGTTPLSPVTPMVLSPVTPMVLSPVTPMVSMGVVQQWPTVQPYQMPPPPVLNPFAPVAPAAAAGYMPYTYGPYTYASTSAVAPVVPTAWGGYTPVAPQGTALPVSPYQYLSGYDPYAPISPATPGIGAALSNALSLGDKILCLLTSTASCSPGIASDKGNLLQTAISIFGAQTGFSPVIQDVIVLARIADKVFKQFQAASGRSTPAPNLQPGVAPPPAPAPLLLLLRQPLRLSPSR